MKVAPVSADLLIKLALGAVVLGGVWYAYRQTRASLDNLSQSASSAAAWVGDAAQFFNPASDQNVIYGGVNTLGAKVTGDTSFSLGSWIYDLVNDDPLAPPKKTTLPIENTGGATGSW